MAHPSHEQLRVYQPAMARIERMVLRIRSYGEGYSARRWACGILTALDGSYCFPPSAPAGRRLQRMLPNFTKNQSLCDGEYNRRMRQAIRSVLQPGLPRIHPRDRFNGCMIMLLSPFPTCVPPAGSASRGRSWPQPRSVPADGSSRRSHEHSRNRLSRRHRSCRRARRN